MQGKKKASYQCLVLGIGEEEDEVDGLEGEADDVGDEGGEPVGRDGGEAVEGPDGAVEECGDVGEGRELLRVPVGHDPLERLSAGPGGTVL